MYKLQFAFLPLPIPPPHSPSPHEQTPPFSLLTQVGNGPSRKNEEGIALPNPPPPLFWL